MKIDSKVIIELSIREAHMLQGFLCEFESEEYGGINLPKHVKKEFIGNLLYDLVTELKKHE